MLAFITILHYISLYCIGEWYNVFGLSMLHTIRYCTDPDYFTDSVKEAWILTYSRMMCIIIPVCLRNQLPSKDDASLQQVFRKTVKTHDNSNSTINDNHNTHGHKYQVHVTANKQINNEIEILSPTDTTKD